MPRWFCYMDGDGADGVEAVTEETARDFSKCIVEGFRASDAGTIEVDGIMFGSSPEGAHVQAVSASWGSTTLQPDGTFLVETGEWKDGEKVVTSRRIADANEMFGGAF